MPAVPSIDEAGLPGVHAGIWIGMLAPSGTPRPIIDRLSKAVNDAIAAEDVIRHMQTQGMEPLGGSPEVFARRIASDTARWDAVLQASGLAK